jgi:hypothetical protein
MRLLAALVALCLVSPARAGLLFYDGFEYDMGERMAPTSDTSGSPDPGQHNVDHNVDWRYVGGGAANNETPVVGSGSLSVTGLRDSVGNSVAYDMTDNGIARVEIPGDPLTEGTLYWSGILRVTNVANLDPTTTGGGGGIFVGGFNNSIGPAASATLFAAHLAISRNASDSSQYFIGSGVNNNSRVFALSNPQAEGDSVFVVVRYTKGPDSADDTISLWVNPDPNSFQTGTAPAPLVTGGLATGSELSAAASFVLRNVTDSSGPDPAIQFDELRIGNTWSSVTPVPEPASFLTLSFAIALACLRRGRHRVT